MAEEDSEKCTSLPSLSFCFFAKVFDRHSCLRFGTLPPKFIVRLPTVTVPLIVNPGAADVCAFELEAGDSEAGGIGIMLADWSRYVESCFCSSLFGLA